MSLITTKFAAELNEKEMRDAYLSAQTRTHVSYQIRAIRSQRGWSQEELAEKLSTSQSAVSRMEDRQYGKQNLQTLIQIANTFNCGLLVQFVPYDEFIRETNDLSREKLEVSGFRTQLFCRYPKICHRLRSTSIIHSQSGAMLLMKPTPRLLTRRIPVHNWLLYSLKYRNWTSFSNGLIS